MKRRSFLKDILISSVMLRTSTYKLAGTNPFFYSDYNEKKCRETWKQLCGKLADKEYLRYVGPKENLTNVFIYGDSISQDYTETVRSELKNEASVFRIYKNGGPSNSVIRKIEHLHKTMFQPHLVGGWNFEWDLIHFNVGLHDLKYLFEGNYDVINGEQVTSPEKYKKNLIEIIKYFQNKHSKAKLIYALTTPVPEGARGRKSGDAAVFNQVALEVLKEFPEIVVNDLYSLTKPNMNQWVRSPGNVHYNELGKLKQGKQVAKIIRKSLYCFTKNRH